MAVAAAVVDPCEVVPGDPAALSDDRLAAEISTLAGHIAAAMCRWLLLVAEFDRREAWGAWDCRSCAHWLSWRCGVNLRTAQEQLRVAHALGRLPRVRQHFATGELSYSKVRAITRVAVEPYEEEFFLHFARHATAPMLEKAVSGYRRSGCLDDEAAAGRHGRREFRWWVEPDGMIAFQGRMAPEDGAVVVAAIEAATVPASKRSAERPVDDQGQPLPQPGDDPKWARQADALVSICGHALAGAGDDEKGLVADPAATVVVHVDDGVMGHDADGACRLADGPNLAPETARRLACDATTWTIATGPDGTPRLVDKAAKTVSRTLRREVAARDRIELLLGETIVQQDPTASIALPVPRPRHDASGVPWNVRPGDTDDAGLPRASPRVGHGRAPSRNPRVTST